MNAWSNFKPLHILGAIGIFLGIMLFRTLSDASVERKDQAALIQLFELPQDPDWRFQGQHSKTGSSHVSTAVVVFSAGEFNNYTRAVADAALWTLDPPVEVAGTTITATAPARALRWWDDNDAFHDGEKVPAWLDMGSLPERAAARYSPSHSLCFAVYGQGPQQEVLQCGDAHPGAPDAVVWALLDPSDRSLHMQIRS